MVIQIIKSSLEAIQPKSDEEFCEINLIGIDRKVTSRFTSYPSTNIYFDVAPRSQKNGTKKADVGTFLRERRVEKS